jgi:hypothetical protein
MAPIVADGTIHGRTVSADPVHDQDPATLNPAVPQRPIRVLTLGSCRVHGPVFEAGTSVVAAYPDLALATTHYFHTVGANLQFLQILAGTASVPQAAYPWIFLDGRFQPPTVPEPKGLRGFLDGIDAVLVEVCADDEINAYGVQLHRQEIVRSFVELGGAAAAAWWASLNRGDDPEPLFGAALAEVVASDRAPALESLLFLRNARLTRTSRADIARALTDLAAFVGRRIGVVTHIDAIGSDGGPIARRRQVIETVVAAAGDAGVPVFQPGIFITTYGQPSVLENGGTDAAHYNPSFLPTAGRALVAFACSFAATRSGPSVGDPAPIKGPVTPPISPVNFPSRAAGASPLAQALAYADLQSLEASMVETLARRLRRLGPDASGLGPYYANRVTLGQAFGPDDRLVLQVLAGGYHDYDLIVEAGAGYSQLALALAALGRRVLAIEVSKARYECMVALQADLAIAYPAMAANAVLLHGSWPDVLAAYDVSRSLFVAVDFAFTATPKARATAIAGLKRHGGAIIDTVHFVDTRLSSELRESFEAELTAAGLSGPVALGGSQGNSAFIFTRPRPA